MKISKGKFLSGVCCVILGSVPAVSFAQETVPAGAPAATGVGEIIVTAQKRSQSINKVGMTIQAASSEQLEARGIDSVADLNKLVAGFTATTTNYGTPVYTLRGIGLYDAAFGSAPAVAVYTDQVPRNFPVLSDGLDLDMERIEVLKGPQGTLFGQSATGGAINYITAKPTDHLEAGFDGSYERFDRVDLSGFVSGPLSDTLKVRLAVRGISGGAWQYSVSRPNDQNGATRQLMGRLTLEWQAADRLKIEASFTGSRDHSDTQAPQYNGTQLNIYSSAALAAANANPATANPYGVVNNALYAGLTTPGSANYDSTFLGRQATVAGRLNGSDPARAAGAAALLGTVIPHGNARAAEWTPFLHGPSDNSYYQGTVRADFDVSDSITLTSVTAFAHKKLNYAVDDDGTVAPIIDVPFFGSVRAFNQELRLSGKTDKLNWMFGGNYDNSRVVQNNFVAIADYSANAPIPGLLITDGENDYSSRLKTIAAFAHAEYKITPNLTVNGGIRYTENRQSATFCYNDPASDIGQAEAGTFSALQNIFTGTTLPPIKPGECFVLGDGQNGTTFGKATLTPHKLSQKEHNVSFRAGIDYRFDQGTLLYMTVSQGYKTGVFSNIGASSVSQYGPAVQEKVVAYEGGFKTPLFGNRVHLNGAAFYYDYTNKQVRGKILDSIFGLQDKMINVPKSYIWGVEGEIQIEPIDGLMIAGSATYLKSQVSSSFTQTVDGKVAYNTENYAGDFKGSELPFTPKYSANADIQYKWAIGTVEPFIGGTMVYQGTSNATYQNSVLLAPSFNLPGYATVDFRAGVGAADGSWKVAAYARNAFNKYYITSASTYLDTNIVMSGRPATYGVSFKVRFQ